MDPKIFGISHKRCKKDRSRETPSKKQLWNRKPPSNMSEQLLIFGFPNVMISAVLMPF